MENFKCIICKNISNDVLEKEISNIGLSVWCLNSLKSNEIYKVSDVLKHGNDFDVHFLKNFRRFGVKCVIELKKCLINLGAIQKVEIETPETPIIVKVKRFTKKQRLALAKKRAVKKKKDQQLVEKAIKSTTTKVKFENLIPREARAKRLFKKPNIHLPEKANHVVNSTGSYTKKLRELIRKKEDFEIICSSNYASIRTVKGVDYKFNRQGTNMKFMGLLTRVKRDIMKNLDVDNPESELFKSLPNYSHLNIRYYCYSKEIIDLSHKISNENKVVPLEELHEYDCTKAYIESAYVLGYLSEPMYQELVKSDKSLRLRILGAIATQKDKFVFRNGREIGNSPVKNEIFRRVWFHICKYLDNCMWQFKKALGDDFMFYWVDGIAFKKSGLEKAKSFSMFAFIRYRLTFHDVKIDNAEIQLVNDSRLNKLLNNKEKISKAIILVKDGTKKRFLLPYGKQRSEKRLPQNIRKKGVNLTSLTVFGR
jgi:hypothetical protein